MRNEATRTFGIGLAAALAAAAAGGCAGEGDGRATAELRGRVEAQSKEVADLRDAMKAMDARNRLLEERLAAAPGSRPAAPAAGGPAAAGAPAAADGAEPAAEAAAPDPFALSAAEWIDSEPGKQKLRDFLAAEEKRKAEIAEQERRDQALAFLKERVAGTLAEQLNLDAKQQQAVITVAMDARDRLTEIWRGARDGRADPAFFQTAREKTQQIRQESLDQLSKSLSTDQVEKLAEMAAGRDGGFLFGPGGGFPGMGGGGRTPGGGGNR
jgi:hypothetical protein